MLRFFFSVLFSTVVSFSDVAISIEGEKLYRCTSSHNIFLVGVDSQGLSLYKSAKVVVETVEHYVRIDTVYYENELDNKSSIFMDGRNLIFVSNNEDMENMSCKLINTTVELEDLSNNELMEYTVEYTQQSIYQEGKNTSEYTNVVDIEAKYEPLSLVYTIIFDTEQMKNDIRYYLKKNNPNILPLILEGEVIKMSNSYRETYKREVIMNDKRLNCSLNGLFLNRGIVLERYYLEASQELFLRTTTALGDCIETE